MERLFLNNDWLFSENFTEDMIDAKFNAASMTKVRIPHTVKETPLHYFDEKEYQMVSGYIRTVDIPAEWKDKALILTFEGVAHEAEVFINGTSVMKHSCGYTAFSADISEYVQFGKQNIITVKCDSRESLNVPPFGFVIDYMTYGGIYRDVYLDIREKSYIKDVFIITKLAERFEVEGVLKVKSSQLSSQIEIENAKE